MLTTSDAILIGIRIDYPTAVPRVTYVKHRDASFDAEDHVKILLDTYHDGRSGYVLAVNANGARYDALVAGQGERGNPNLGRHLGGLDVAYRNGLVGRDPNSH